MEKKTERVELLVKNIPGVLMQVVGHIRNEGWNIKRLWVDETENSEFSHMEIDVEGTHTKLALVMEHLLDIDCVVSVAMNVGGKKQIRNKRLVPAIQKDQAQEKISAIPAKKSGTFRILTVNPGSTSTKFALYDNDEEIFSHIIRHDSKNLERCGSVLGQKNYRKNQILEVLGRAGMDMSSIDAIAGRGGFLKPVESGTYLVNETMLEDLRSAATAIHASVLGGIIADEIAEQHEIPAFVVDPIVVDETDRKAKLTGMPGIERTSIFHALNQKAIARRLAAKLGKPYENCRFIVAHLGGGITVGAHCYGRVIDVNDGLSGEGAFTPERSGGVPAVPLIQMCYSGEYTKEEMIDRVSKKGGMLAYLGTNDMRSVEKMIKSGDEFAALVLDTMAYQVSKEIGAMTAVLEGRVDAIVLTGGLAYSSRFTGSIKERVDRLAPIYVFPGEDEMLALKEGALRVLRGEESVSLYE